jgi:hypothetical protein
VGVFVAARAGTRRAPAWTWLPWLVVTGGYWYARNLVLVGLVAFLGYLVTPFGAGGPEGRPILFDRDLRFAFPALTLGLVLLPRVVPPTTGTRRLWIPALLVVGAANDLAYTLQLRLGLLIVAFVLAAAVLAAVSALVRSRRSRLSRMLLVGFVILCLIMGGWVTQRSYLRHRYTSASSDPPYAAAPRAELDLLYNWVRHVSHARIALVGLGISYPLVGSDLSNTVQYIGRRGPHGAFDRISSCPEWRRQLNAGRYDYVVISANLRRANEPTEARWTRSDPAAELVSEVRTASVYRVKGAFDPHACPVPGR